MTVDRTFAVAAAEPFDVPALLGFLGSRTVTGVEAYAVQGNELRYTRTVRLTQAPGLVELTWTGHELLATTRTAPADQDEAAAVVARLCDADAPAAEIAAHLGRSEALRPLVAVRPGLRVPGAVDPAEMAVRTLIGQQVSLAAAATCAAKLATAYGEAVDWPGTGLTRLFPTPAALAEVDPQTLPMPRARGRALVGLARALADQTLDLEDRPALLAQPGIGPWTADYLAMRAFRDRDVLLGTDLVIRRVLAARAITDTAAWSPFRSYATMQLWYSAVDFGA